MKELSGDAPTRQTTPLPLVSVIMPAWRAAATLVEAVASVQAQSLTDWELLIIDDASDDATLMLATGLAAADGRIKVLSQTHNSGAAQARNRGILAARGLYIAFLDADDLWMPRKLERQISFMRRSGAVFSYTGFWREAAGKRRLVHIPPQVDHGQLLRGNVIGCLTAIYDSAALGKVLMPDLRMRQDYALWLKILRLTPQAHGLPEPLAVHRRRAGSLSAGAWAGLRATWRMYREAENLSSSRALFYLSCHVRNRLFAHQRVVKPATKGSA
jgi:teichuronic acid biosynthesis glycosyltransferase TuaG